MAATLIDTRQSGRWYRYLVSWRFGSAVRRPILVVVAVVLGAILWWWPGLTGGDQRVTVIGSGEIGEARKDLSRRLREAGLSVDWVTGVSTWCEVEVALERRPAGATVVLAPDDFEPCAEPVERILTDTFDRGLAERTVVVTFGPSPDADTLVDRGARRVPVDRLIGAPGEPVPCVWWEDCPDSGEVITRDSGGLTPEGLQRLARLITAQVA